MAVILWSIFDEEKDPSDDDGVDGEQQFVGRRKEKRYSGLNKHVVNLIFLP